MRHPISGNISFIKEETEEEVKSIKPFYFYSIDDLPIAFGQSFGSNKLRSLFLKKYVDQNKGFKKLKDSEIKVNANVLWSNLYKHIFKELGFPKNAYTRIWAITFESIHKSLEKAFSSWKFTSFGGKTQGVDPDPKDKAVLILGDLSNKETINSIESVYYKGKPISDWIKTTYDGFSVKDDNSEVKEFVWTVILRESVEYLMRGRGRIPVIHLGKLYKRKDNQDIVKRVFGDMKVVMTKPRALICGKCGHKNIVLNKAKTIKCKNCKEILWIG